MNRKEKKAAKKELIKIADQRTINILSFEHKVKSIFLSLIRWIVLIGIAYIIVGPFLLIIALLTLVLPTS